MSFRIEDLDGALQTVTFTLFSAWDKVLRLDPRPEELPSVLTEDELTLFLAFNVIMDRRRSHL